jgi:1,4-dihydroxy-2-naphthoyl-CoA synthase
MADGYESLRYEAAADHVVRIVLDRPEAANALSPALFAELDDALDRIEHDDDVRVWIITGARGPTVGPGSARVPISRPRSSRSPLGVERPTPPRSSTASTRC